MSEGPEFKEGTRKEATGPGGGEALAIRTELATHGEMLRQILTILQVEAGQEGPQLGDLLEALISEIGQNSRSIQTLAKAVEKLGRELSGELVAAIDGNLDVTRRTTTDENDANGSGPLPS